MEGTSVPVELLRKYDRSGPRYTSYPTVPIWSNEVGAGDYQAALKAASARKAEPLALYFHIPFCKRRCYYCGCNTVVTNNAERINSYIDALRSELSSVAAALSGRNKVSQLHFGGGTPTFVDCRGLKEIFELIGSHFELLPACEKSIEIDPRVTSLEQLDFLSANGFNRISLGVQDFDPDVQRASGRVQSYEQIERIIAHCRKLKFKGVNLDLIYGLPLQNVDSFSTTLDKAISLRPDRFAIYSFAYLPSSMPHQSAIQRADLPETEVKYRLFATAIEKLTAAGFKQIGMDHFARPEDELAVAQSDGRLHRNFMGYTVQSAIEMIGIGMSSIGYVNRSFFQNFSKLDSYQSAVKKSGLATFRGLKLTDDDLIRQFVISTLMCNFRLNYDQLFERFGIHYMEYFPAEHEKLKEFFEDDLLHVTRSGLEIAPVGRTFVRNIAMTFDAYLNGNGKGAAAIFSRTI
jgi:oxygen-independent coproporphyrinogen-3 oxidase